MPIPLTPPPAVPNRGDPATFAARADPYLAWIATAVAEISALTIGDFISSGFLKGQQLTIANGAVAEIPIAADFSSGLMEFRVNGASTFYGGVFFRITSGGLAMVARNVGSGIDVSVVNLTGATGTAGRVTLSAQLNKLQIENRSGATFAFYYLITP